MAESRFYVVKYDALSFEADPDRPGRSRSYAYDEVSPPTPIGEGYPTREAAVKAAEGLMGTSRGGEVELDMANGEHYKGPRYYYTIGTVYK